MVEGRDIYYEAEIRDFAKDNRILNIIHYKPQYLDDFPNQKPKTSFYAVHFVDNYWPAPSVDLAFYKRLIFLHLFTEVTPKEHILFHRIRHRGSDTSIVDPFLKERRGLLEIMILWLKD